MGPMMGTTFGISVIIMKLNQEGEDLRRMEIIMIILQMTETTCGILETIMKLNQGRKGHHRKEITLNTLLMMVTTSGILEIIMSQAENNDAHSLALSPAVLHSYIFFIRSL